MHDWIEALAALQRTGSAAVIVTVAAVKGSAPRAAGTKMLVTADAVQGTIGGGHLEFTAIDIARRQLAGGDAALVRRFPLGASLGQCCGGVVNLLFETVVPVDFHIVLFGAGHVGRALVPILGGIPCRVTWVDTRDDAFPAAVPDNVETVLTDAPTAEVDAAAPGSYFLVMTHNHALDEELSERILRRGDFAHFGLIGSVSKRRQFERRLAAKGISGARLAAMTCPIGIAGIAGKEPGVIAVAIAADVLQRRAVAGVQNGRLTMTGVNG